MLEDKARRWFHDLKRAGYSPCFTVKDDLWELSLRYKGRQRVYMGYDPNTTVEDAVEALLTYAGEPERESFREDGHEAGDV